MSIKLAALIARTKAAIDAETDPRKLRPLQASLAAQLATKAEMDDDDEDDKDKDDDEDDDDESKSKKAAKMAAKAKGKAEAAKHKAKAAEYKAKAAECEEAAKAAEEDDEEEAEESAAAAPAGVAGHEALLTRLAESVAKIERTQIASTKSALIGGARKLGAITKAEAKWLDAQALGSVESFLEMRTKAGLVVTSEDALVRPKHEAAPGSEASLPEDTRKMIEEAVANFPGDKKVLREKLVKSHTDQMTAALNGGAGGRY
jgi:hypothetical protein